MAERATLNQVVQIGPEATPGDVAAVVTKKFQTLGITPSLGLNVDTFRAAGAKYSSLNTLSKEWSTAAVSGRGSYTEMAYALAGVVNDPVITTPATGTLSRTQTFTSSTFGTDDPVTFVVEHGSAERASLFRYGMFNEFGIRMSRNNVEVSGAMMGRAITDGVTLTSSGVTLLDLIPILPGQISVYIDPTAAALGTTKMLRAVSIDFRISNRFNPVWVLDAAQNSFVAHIESEPTVSMNVVLEADAQGMGLLDNLRDGEKAFIRVEAVGPIIETTIPYKFTLDFSGEVSQTDGFNDQEGLFAIGWTFNAVHDATWAKAYQLALTNKLATLA